MRECAARGGVRSPIGEFWARGEQHGFAVGGDWMTSRCSFHGWTAHRRLSSSTADRNRLENRRLDGRRVGNGN